MSAPLATSEVRWRCAACRETSTARATSLARKRVSPVKSSRTWVRTLGRDMEPNRKPLVLNRKLMLGNVNFGAPVATRNCRLHHHADVGLPSGCLVAAGARATAAARSGPWTTEPRHPQVERVTPWAYPTTVGAGRTAESRRVGNRESLAGYRCARGRGTRGAESRPVSPSR